MQARSSLKPLFLVGALLLSAGAASRLSAQNSLSFTEAGVSGTPAVATNVAAVPAPLRTYTGTVIQTSAAGVKSNGTITVSFYKGGGLDATITLNGVVTTYFGELLPSSSTLRLTPGGMRPNRTTGFLNPLTTVTTQEGGTVAFTFIDNQLPVIVNKSAAYGGLQKDDGSTLTFRAARAAE